MRRPTRTAFVISSLVLLTAGSAVAQASKLFKWVDEHGNVHYSDRMEASAATAKVQRINASGVQVGNPHSALPTSKEEIRQHEEARRLAQLDMMLLSSYRSELELLRSHDESREPIENGLRAAESNIARLRQELVIRQSALPATPEGAAPTADIQRLRDQIGAEEASLEKLRARRFELYERQNFEVSRYRELTTHTG